MITTLICCLVAFCIGTMVGTFVIALLISNKGTQYEKLTSVWIAKDEKFGTHIYECKPYKKNGYWHTNNGYYFGVNPDWLPKQVNPSFDDEEPIEIDMIIRCTDYNEE